MAVLACGAAAAGAPVAAMTVLGLALFAAPGYLLGQLLLDSRTTGLERVAFSAGLALAVPVLGGLVLYTAGVPLHRPGWLGLLAGVTLACDVALLLRRRVPASGRAAPLTWRPSWRVPPWHVAAFAAAVVIAASGVGLARIGVTRQPQPGFTQLWLSPRHQNGHMLSLGVKNDQGITTRYRLVVLRNGHVITARNINLADGQTWQQSVPFTGNGTLTADLYRLADLVHPYRHVSTGRTKAARS
ncbi:MAG TPA: DUF1616 domain-containing protein [Trebonia sp.]